MEATQRQLETLRSFGIATDGQLSRERASELISEAIRSGKERKVDTEALKAQYPLEVVVEQFSHQQVGRDRKIFAPWRAESTPSLHVYPDGNWKDYGTGESGDMFDFIGRMHFSDYDRHAHFIHIVDMLGGLGIKPISQPVSRPAPKEKPKTRVRLEQVMAWSDALPEEYRQYWRDRGLTDLTIDRFMLGYDGRRLTIPATYRGVPFAVRRRVTPDDWAAAEAQYEAVLAPLRQGNPELTDKELLAQFRKRLKAEHPDWTPTDIKQATPSMPPKYVGMEGDTVGIFNADVLGNDAHTVVICEGEVDCMLLDQAGYQAVSSTGGAGTWKPEWVRFFTHCRKVYLLFDNDEAGLNGLKKVHTLMRRAKPIFLPAGVKDVGDMWETGNLDAWLRQNVK